MGFFAYPRKEVQSRITPPKRSRFRSGFQPIPERFRSLLIDASGNLFASDWDTGSIFKFTPNGTKNTFATAGSVGTALAADRAGNLFAADAEKRTSMKFEPTGSSSVFAAGITASVLAVDQAGNLFAGDSENTIFKFTASGTKSEFGKTPEPP